jgi:CheY-like chemotaxis protein/PAS domain-containing protein/HPt (histidine-containing phosphotransfer) domain-containing protein
MVNLKDRCRIKKTVIVGLFCLGALVYLCMLARVNIQNFKGSFSRQSRAYLVNLARAQARHIEVSFKNLELQIERTALRVTSEKNKSLKTDDWMREFGFPVEAFFICDLQGGILGSFAEDAEVPIQPQAFREVLGLGPIGDGAVRLDPLNADRIWIISAIDNEGILQGYASVALHWDDLLQSLRIAGVTSKDSFLFADPQLRRSPEGVPDADALLARTAKGFEGAAVVGAATDEAKAYEGNLLAGYCPAFLHNECWPVAVVADDTQMQAAVKAHAEGIFVAMICLFLVMLVIYGSYYMSERRRLILEQQTQLSSTTTELHIVAAEKRRVTEQYKHEISFLRQVLNAIPFGLYWKDENGRLLGQNPALGAMLEQSDNPAEAMNVINDQALDHEVLVKGVGLMHVPQTLKKLGEDQQILVSRIPLRGANGHITGTLSCQLPASCFKNLHAGCVCDFLDNECIADTWAVPMLLIGADQKILYSNPAFVQWGGFSHEQIYAAPYDRLLGLTGSDLAEIARADAAGKWMPLAVRRKSVQVFVQPVAIGRRDAMLMLLAERCTKASAGDGDCTFSDAVHTTCSDVPQDSAGDAMQPDVLVVDDIEENRILLEMLLKKEGCKVTNCSGGSEAVKLCRQRRFDLVLMDIQMPDMDGFETLRQIRLNELNFSTPVIAMTASERREDEIAAIECGFDDYLSKPVNQKIVRQKTWRALQKVKQADDAVAGRDIVSFLDGDPDYGRAIETFVQNLPGRLDEMKDAFESRDFRSLAFKVHALKGVGGFAGFSVYTEKARQMEDAIRQQQIDNIARQLDELMDMCLRTRLKSDCL